MKRNKYGINFDFGVPLQTKEEFELLYVDIYEKEKNRLVTWIKNEKRESAIVAGQIGTGKSTLIEKARSESRVSFDIQIALDTEIPLYDRGAFWGVFLGKIFRFADKKACDVSPFRFSEDLLGIKYTDGGIIKLVEALCAKPLSFSDFNEKKKLYNMIDEKLEFIKRQLKDIVELIENKIGRKLFIFAEGVDKFNLHSPEYVSLLDFLNFLNRCKTLYEANLIHLTGGVQEWHHGKKHYLTGTTSKRIHEILKKRLGVYGKEKKAVLPVLANLSGGNVRQGIRLLVEYDYAFGKEGKNEKDALDEACRRVREDLLVIPASMISPALLKVVHSDKYIASGTLNAPGALDDGKSAVYRNLIIIKDEADENLRWPSDVNPLLLPAVEAFRDLPESPETKMLQTWAKEHEVSPLGLDIDIDKVDRNNFFDIIGISNSVVSSLKITEILDSMASYFLNSERKDKIIIAYKNIESARLGNDFIIGRAGTYKPGYFKDINYDDVPGHRLDIFPGIFAGEQYDGYSIFFEKKLSKHELITLDQSRDVFIDHKMIWWIPYDDLVGYLKYWPQLRQLFNIFHLEADIFGSLSVQEIEEDLGDIEGIDFAEHEKEQLKKRLRNVLCFLEKRNDEK